MAKLATEKRIFIMPTTKHKITHLPSHLIILLFPLMIRWRNNILKDFNACVCVLYVKYNEIRKVHIKIIMS